jgi:hypothetical protein
MTIDSTVDLTSAIAVDLAPCYLTRDIISRLIKVLQIKQKNQVIRKISKISRLIRVPLIKQGNQVIILS